MNASRLDERPLCSSPCASRTPNRTPRVATFGLADKLSCRLPAEEVARTYVSSKGQATCWCPELKPHQVCLWCRSPQTIGSRHIMRDGGGGDMIARSILNAGYALTSPKPCLVGSTAAVTHGSREGRAFALDGEARTHLSRDSIATQAAIVPD